MLDQELLNLLKDYNHRRKYNIDFVKDKKLESLLSSRYQKISRIKQHFVWLIHKKRNIYFVTFTFNDYYINKSDRTRKDLIKKSLNDFDENLYYIINIDYGKQSERLHYHAIIGTDSDLSLKSFLDLSYPCFSYTEKIRFDVDSFKKLSKYLNKLSNHAVKKSTRNSRILYNFKGYGIINRKQCPEVYFAYKDDKDCLGLT